MPFQPFQSLYQYLKPGDAKLFTVFDRINLVFKSLKVTTQEIQYKDHAGNNQTVTVVTNVEFQ